MGERRQRKLGFSSQRRKEVLSKELLGEANQKGEELISKK